MTEFTNGYRLSRGPSGHLSVQSTEEPETFYSIAAFLVSNFNPRTAEQKLALCHALEKGMTTHNALPQWLEIAEGHRDDMRKSLETRDDSRAEQLARAADAVAVAIQRYDAIAATKP